MAGAMIRRVGRPTSTKYYRRVAAVRPVTERLRTEIAIELEFGLVKATKHELYDRTPLPVTGMMMKSIGSRINVPGMSREVVEVGFNIGDNAAAGFVAPYAGVRVNMTGISVLGGHNLHMRLSYYLQLYSSGAIRRWTRMAQKGILGR